MAEVIQSNGPPIEFEDAEELIHAIHHGDADALVVMKGTDPQVVTIAGTDLLRLSFEPMLAFQLDGPIEFWNAGAERLYGFAPDEAIGRSSHALLQTKFPIEFTDLRSQLQNSHYWSGELRHTCKDGREVIVDSRMQLLVMAGCLKPIVTLPNASRSKARFTKMKSDCVGWRQLSISATMRS